MTLIPDFYPVPATPPDEGLQHTCRIADAWIPILIGQMSALRDKSKWKNPPSDIVAQIDHFIWQIESVYELVQIFPTFYTHLHQNSKVTTGNPISFLVNTGQEMNGVWRQNAAAINDASYFQMVLDAGDYEVDICHVKSSGAGKLNVSLQGVLGTHVLDLYAAATTLNQHDVYTITNPAAGLKTVNLGTNSKNAASSGYVINLTYISFRKVS
jgi:hypothetical protein